MEGINMFCKQASGISIGRLSQRPTSPAQKSEARAARGKNLIQNEKKQKTPGLQNSWLENLRT
jgi:hypothetical protein